MKPLSTAQKTLLALFLGVVFLYSFNQLKESDAFYHLRTGQLVWETGSVPHKDVFSYTAPGRMWVTHEWLGELIFYGAYALGGFWGLISFIALLSVLTYFVIFILAMKKGAAFDLSLLAVFLCGSLTFELWIPRPQIFAFLSLTLLVYFLESYRMGKERKYLLLSSLTIWFWANVNASFLLGLVIIFFYFFSELLKKRFPAALGAPMKTKETGLIGASAAAALGLSFVNPNGYAIFLYSSYIKPAVKALQILEWKPIYFFWYENEAKLFLVMMFAVALLCSYWFWFRKESRDATWLGAVLGVAVLPFISIRHVGFIPIIAAAPLAVAASGVTRKLSASLSDRFVPTVITVLFLIFAVARYPHVPRSPVNASTVPVGAADFIKENGIKGPLFNFYNEGGYLIWRLWPGEKVFIDGRSEVYGGQPINELFTVIGRLKGWRDLVDKKYGINYFILPYWPESLGEQTGALAKDLAKDDFHLVYWDDNSVIFLRKTGDTSALIGKYEMKHISPFIPPESISCSEARAAAGELEKLVSHSAGSSNIEDYLRRFLSVPLCEKTSS